MGIKVTLSFLGGLRCYLVWSFLVAYPVHAPSHDEYEDECWKKHNYHSFTAFALAFEVTKFAPD